MSDLQRGDNHIIAFSKALTRSEQLLTGAGMTEDEDDQARWTDWAISIAQEWDMHEDLRQAIADAARENVNCDRSLGPVE